MRQFLTYFCVALAAQASILIIWLSTGVLELLVYFFYFVPWLYLDLYSQRPKQFIMADGSADLWVMLGGPAVVYSIVIAGLGFLIGKYVRALKHKANY
jgi:hypothetical protein